jgi:hypothetical protein
MRTAANTNSGTMGAPVKEIAGGAAAAVGGSCGEAGGLCAVCGAAVACALPGWVAIVVVVVVVDTLVTVT